MLDRALSEEIIRSGLDFMHVSFPGPGDREYEYACGSRFRTVSDNVTDFFRLRKRSGSKRPRTTISIRHAGRLSPEGRTFVRRWRSLADAVVVNAARDIIGQVAAADGERPGATQKRAKYPCPRLWSRATVLWDGRVALCCRDMNGEYIVGDANRESLYDIWNGERLGLMRQRHLDRQFGDIPLCERCDETIMR